MVSCYLKGNMGNQIFIIAATIAYAKNHRLEYHIPAETINNIWKYSLPNLENKNYNCELEKIIINEKRFEYDELPFKKEWGDKNIILGSASAYDGFFQSYKYFNLYLNDIKSAIFSDYKNQPSLMPIYVNFFQKPVIGISVRRGDYITNPNFELLPFEYYENALIDNFSNKFGNIVVFSDDIKWCKQKFSKYKNVFYAEMSPLEQLYLATSCDHFILANSTFSFWLAMFGKKEESIIIRPSQYFSGKLSYMNISDLYPDIYPEKWIEFDYKKEAV